MDGANMNAQVCFSVHNFAFVYLYVGPRFWQE